MTLPLTAEVTMMPSMSGVSSRPAFVGLLPRTICRYSGRITRAPNIAAPTSRATALLVLKTLLRKTRSGRIAASPIRPSQGTNDTRAASVSAVRPSVRPEPQPHSRPFSATSSSGTIAVVSSAAPT